MATQPDGRDMKVLTAALELIRRTGATTAQIRYSDDEEPTVWMAVAQYGSRGLFDAAAAPTPDRAAVRLAKQLLAGGFCVHCGRPPALAEQGEEYDPDDGNCWYVYDGDETFVRGCEDA